MHMLDNNNCFAFNEDDEDIKFQNVTLTRSACFQSTPKIENN